MSHNIINSDVDNTNINNCNNTSPNNSNNNSNFIKNIIINDLKTHKHDKIITRFPPEPNGFLHIGHAKSICLNFGLAEEFLGVCNLRFDDTNPEKETEEYVNSIIESIQWLGFMWHENIKYASDYFDTLYNFAEYFIQQNLAYVCELTPDEIRQMRGDLTKSGSNSPYRNRSVDENLSLFRQMKNGDFADGSKTLRLKIDMSSPNLNLRDPVIYRIKRSHHIRTHDKWCIYPMYDYTHCISDALENITHSCCTLEFEDHRPLYDWVLDKLFAAKLISSHPRQIEFSRLELDYTVTSKRKLNQLVSNNIVDGWDDPRMPTIMGMRRRGFTADGLKLFALRCGISKSPNIVDIKLLESSIREDLEHKALRVMAVFKPLKIIITNYDENKIIARDILLHPEHSSYGSRSIKLSKEIYIEQTDFLVLPIKNWQRLAPNTEVRLRHSYIIKCNHIVYHQDIVNTQDQDIINDINNIKELHCTIDYDSLGKNPTDRKVKGVIHWVNSDDHIAIQVNIYDNLFLQAQPDKDNFLESVNPNSLRIVTALVEPIIKQSLPETNYQFERIGYFVTDRVNHKPNKNQFIFNKTIALKDSFKKLN